MKRAHLLALSLTGTLILAWVAPRDDDIAEAAPKTRPGRKVAAAEGKPVQSAAPKTPQRRAERGRIVGAERPPQPADVPDLFKAFSWYVPPPPPPPAASPPLPKPTAPPLPYAFVGHYAEDDRSVVILARGDRVVTASVGEVIDKTYLVERMANGELSFIYLPLATKQMLHTGVIQ